MKPTATGSSSSYICLAIYFSFALLFRSIKPKIQKYLAALYFICDLLFQSITIFSRQRAFWRRYPKGIDNPFNVGLRVVVICVQGMFTFCCFVLLLVRYLGFITEGNTYRCCDTSSSPLGGNTDVVLANIIKGISGAVAGEDLQHNQVPNHKSHLLAIYIICHLPLVFLSPTSEIFSVLFASLFSPISCL